MIEPRLASCQAERENVQLIRSLFTEEDYEYVFEYRDASLTYEVFLEAASLFPMFCGEFVARSPNLETKEKACMREMATFFAHIAVESGTPDGLPSGGDDWR